MNITLFLNEFLCIHTHKDIRIQGVSKGFRRNKEYFFSLRLTIFTVEHRVTFHLEWRKIHDGVKCLDFEAATHLLICY